MSFPFLRDRPIPSLEKQPCTDNDQDERPEAVHAEREPAHVIEQKQTAETNQNHSANGDVVVAARVVRCRLGVHRRLRRTPGWVSAGGIRRCGCSLLPLPVVALRSAGSKHGFEAEWIRERPAVLNSLRRLVGVENHVEHKEPDENAKDPRDVVCQENQDYEGQSVNDSLHELTVVHRTHARDKAQQSRYHRPALRRDNNIRTRRVGHALGRRSAVHLLAYTRVAIHHAAHIPRARAAQWFAAGSAVRDSGCTAMICAIHASLLAVSDPAASDPSSEFSLAVPVAAGWALSNCATSGWVAS